MQTLLQDRFAPITSSAGFLEAAPKEATEALHQWRESLHPNVRCERLSEAFPAALHRLEPLTIGFIPRELLVATRSDWTAYFNNNLHGTDTSGPFGHLCRLLNCRGLAVSCAAETVNREETPARGQFAIIKFELYGSQPTEWLNIVRVVEVSSDYGGWEFHTDGPVQPYEQPERYQARRIRDRFTPEMLDQYCQALGVHYFDPEFYGPESTLVEVMEPYPKPRRSLTLTEVQQELRIQPGHN